METSKETSGRFFTPERIWWAFVYDLMLVGALAGYIFFEVKVMGNDMEMRTGYEASAPRKR